MASMCSNPNCGNIRRVEGICPECGSPAEDLGFKEGTALIKLKKENVNRKNDETAAEAQKIIDQMDVEAAAEEEEDSVSITGKIETVEPEEDQIADIQSSESKPGDEIVKTSKGRRGTLFKILVFIISVIIFYVIFTLLLNGLV
ncbi:MAG: hypothetical protein Q4P17_08195 [Methanobacterium sp.]|nr:hypothetical protein [Methanobacterium sp.]